MGRSSARWPTPGLPDGVLNLVTNKPEDAGEVVNALIAHPAVQRVNFTGSTRVGRLIAQECAKHLKRPLLELGGKAPLIVLADADLDEAAAAANFGAFMNQGQICMSTERIVAERSVASELAAKLAERAGALVTGDPTDPGTQIGALVDERSLSRVGELVEDARAQGCGGARGRPRRRPVLPAHGAGRRHARDADLRRGVLRAGRLGRRGG